MPERTTTHAGPTRGRWSGRRPWIIAGSLALAVIVGAAVAFVTLRGSSQPFRVRFKDMSGLQAGPPPWNNDVGGLPNQLASVRLDKLPQEALAFHIHEHLDAYVNGKRVTVPAGIGIEPGSFITQVHTHTPDGVIHVESAREQHYLLGQLFGEWAVRLNARCIGRYCGNLHWWVNGVRGTGNPAALVLRQHQEIVIAAGKPPHTIPSHFAFPTGA